MLSWTKLEAPEGLCVCLLCPVLGALSVLRVRFPLGAYLFARRMHCCYYRSSSLLPLFWPNLSLQRYGRWIGLLFPGLSWQESPRGETLTCYFVFRCFPSEFLLDGCSRLLLDLPRPGVSRPCWHLLCFLVEVSSSAQTLALLRSSPLFMPNPDSRAGPGDAGLFLQDTTVRGSQILI